MDRNYLFMIITALWCLPIVKSICNDPNCAVCNGGGNNCAECKKGFRVDGNNYCSSCPTNCLTCTADDLCQSCSPGFWGYRCLYTCPGNCNEYGCDMNSGTKCFNCKIGWYGPQCQQECNRCENERCEFLKCSTGCKDGYIQEMNNGISNCIPCPLYCKRCSNSTFCTECYSGQYINQYTVGAEVVTSCSSCSLVVQKCVDCTYDQNQVSCQNCETGYVVNQSNECVPTGTCIHCQNGCDVENRCFGGCQPGWTSTKCDYRCSSACETCITQDACLSCKDGFYSQKCNVLCNTNCQSGNYPRCRFGDGYCSNGCNKGFWGDQCQYNCNNNCLDITTSSELCHRNGTCYFGCKSGYMGSDCSQISPTSPSPFSSTTTLQASTEQTSPISSTTTLQASTEQSSPISTTTFITSTDKTIQISATTNDATEQSPAGDTLKHEQPYNELPVAAIGGGAGGGGAVLVAVVVVAVICLLKRRKRNANEEQKGTIAGSGQALNRAFDPESVNAEPSLESSAQPFDYIYAQPNKPKKQDINKDSIQYPHAYSSVKINTNDIHLDINVDVGDETDTDDVVKLEDLDDGESDVIVAKAVAPSSDTYYNTEGLKRSRIQVLKLLDYIQGKSDFQSEFERLPKTLTRSCNEALKPQNRAKNRYNGIYSYDATRVVLRSKEYINASHIDGYNNSKAYIASLGPTKSTMPQFAVFWEMVWQENTQKMVMLTNLTESGKSKCDQYWPDTGSSRQYGSVSVTAKAEHVYAEFVVRELLVLKARETRTVTQYHYTAWPDKSVPDTVVSLVEFRDIVEKKRTPKAGPMVVHCSAGIGRTGTYISLDTLIKEGKAENSVDIFGCVNALRGQRVNMVQNAEQYEFLHHCVVYALTCQPDPLDVSSLTSFRTDDNMIQQFQAVTNLLPLANKETDSIAINAKRKENRKGSDIPGDRHRVKLAGTKKDYINAVFVDGYLQKNRYILAQTPMPSTLEDFISLLYQEKIGLVVCLDEEDTKDKTVGKYVTPVNKVSRIGHFNVSTDSCESSEEFVVRSLKISKIGLSIAHDLKIQHYQFLCWKNRDSVPESLQEFMNLIRVVNKHCGPESGTVTILFHCLDGATKSGLMCAVAIMLEKLAVERELSVVNTICHVRGRRREAIHGLDQFKFCYDCVRDHLETSEAKTYYNIL